MGPTKRRLTITLNPLQPLDGQLIAALEIVGGDVASAIKLLAIRGVNADPGMSGTLAKGLSIASEFRKSKTGNAKSQIKIQVKKQTNGFEFTDGKQTTNGSTIETAPVVAPAIPIIETAPTVETAPVIVAPIIPTVETSLIVGAIPTVEVVLSDIELIDREYELEMEQRRQSIPTVQANVANTPTPVRAANPADDLSNF